MAQVIRGSISPEMDINVLFEKSTIEEIQQIEKKTRSDIERKKEDLRQMVGERYRDLIEAADTITEMKTSAENVTESIARMQSLCQGLKSMQKMSQKPIASEKTKKQKENLVMYGIATQVKVLQDMPEKIWSCLDSGHFLRATQLYLLARHIWTNLQSEGYHSSNFLSRISVLQTQWAAISHFRATILEKSRDTLKEPNAADQLTAECLSSILLLEDTTPRQVFNEFLLLRKNAVEKVFHSETGQQSIKDQVCEVVKTISNTIHQIYSLFYHPPEGSAPVTTSDLFMKVIKEVTDQGEAGLIVPTQPGSLSAKYLPSSITAFRPVLKHNAVPISTSSLKQNCQDWIKTCTQDLQSGLEPLLSFIKTVKGLSAIRDQVWDILYEDEKQTTWDAICKEIVGHPIALWEDLLRPHFNARVQAILLGHFNEALNTCELQTARVLVDLNDPKEKYTEVEHDVCNYVWIESNSDIAPQSAWVSVNNKTLADSGTLLMKARAYTPAIQSLCKNYDGRLGVLLEDIRFYLKDAKTENKATAKTDFSTSSEDIVEQKKAPFDKYADNELIQSFIKSSCKDCVRKLLDIFNQQLDSCKDQLKQGEPRNIRSLTDKALLLGRLSSALCELSPHMQQCMMGHTDKMELPRLPRKGSSRTKQPEDPEWTQLKTSLQQFSQSAFRLWTDSLVSHLVQTFKAGLLDASSHGVLLATLRWDEVMIQEETEDGSTVKSSIRVPMQASWYIQTLLYNICADINRVGGHALNRVILQELVDSINEKILLAYEELLKNQQKERSQELNVPMGQVRALQLLFDLKLLSNVLPRKQNENEAKKHATKVNKVIESLEGLIDPFDLDVFSPYIQGHLNKQTQRCHVLYGALMSLDKHSMFLGMKHLGTSQQENHNILPMATNQNRFPLLPLSVQNRSSMVAPIVQAPKSKMPISPPLGRLVPDLSGGHEASMSSSLFGNWFSARK